MLAKVMSCAIVGLDGALVEVEADISPGLPVFTIVGLPDKAVQEARDRVRSAIRNSGFDFPTRRITVNLAPADLKKEGPAYDLAIAIGLLMSSGQLVADVRNIVFLGELALDGRLRHTQGMLPMISVVREAGMARAAVPLEDHAEASLVGNVDICATESLDSRITPRPHSSETSTSAPPSRSLNSSPGSRATCLYPNLLLPPLPQTTKRTRPSICVMSRARSTPSERWKWQPRATITWSWQGHQAAARRCLRGRSR